MDLGQSLRDSTKRQPLSSKGGVGLGKSTLSGSMKSEWLLSRQSPKKIPTLFFQFTFLAKMVISNEDVPIPEIGVSRNSKILKNPHKTLIIFLHLVPASVYKNDAMILLHIFNDLVAYFQ